MDILPQNLLLITWYHSFGLFIFFLPYYLKAWKNGNMELLLRSSEIREEVGIADYSQNGDFQN